MAAKQIASGAVATAVGDIGPWFDGNDNCYCYLSDTGPTYYPDMYKSTEPLTGTWSIQDSGGAPSLGYGTNNCSGYLDGDTIHCITCDRVSDTKNEYRYHQFHVSTHSTTPDEWDGTVVDELIEDANAELLSTHYWGAYIRTRSDGDVIVLYNGNGVKDKGVKYASVKYARRESGSWTVDIDVSPLDAYNYYAAAMGVGESDNIYLQYNRVTGSSTNGIYVKQLNSSNTLGSATTIATTTAYQCRPQNIPYYDDGGVEVMCIGWAHSSGHQYTTYLRDNSAQTATEAVNAADNEFPFVFAMCRKANVKTNYIIYQSNTDVDLEYEENDDEGGWSSNQNLLSDGSSDFSERMMSATIADHGGGTVLAAIYRDYNWYYDEASFGQTESLVAAIDGSATVTALLSVQAPLVTAIDGSATIAADLSKISKKQLAVDLTGSGLLVGDLTRTRSIVAAIDGSGLIGADLRKKYGFLADVTADATVVSDLLVDIPVQIEVDYYIWHIQQRPIYRR